MLYLYEVHKVNILERLEFEARYRDSGGFMELIAEGDAGRLLWFTEVPMSTGTSNTYVTLSVFKDAAAWGRFADRVHDGDLAEWRTAIDRVRHWSDARLLKPVTWSKLQDVDFSTIPVAPQQHATTPIMQEWMKPNDGKVPEYLDLVERMMLPLYDTPGGATFKLGEEGSGDSMWASMGGAFVPAFGGGGGQQQVLLWSPITNLTDWMEFVMSEDPGTYPEGSWLSEAAKLRGEWESKLLRTAHWSPLS